MSAAASTPAVAFLTTAQYLGCYTDITGALNGQRALAASSFTSTAMTVELCAAQMITYQYFGLEYAN